MKVQIKTKLREEDVYLGPLSFRTIFKRKGTIEDCRVVGSPQFCCEKMKEAWEERAIIFGEIDGVHTNADVNITLCHPYPEGACFDEYPIKFCPFCAEPIIILDEKEYEAQELGIDLDGLSHALKQYIKENYTVYTEGILKCSIPQRHQHEIFKWIDKSNTEGINLFFTIETYKLIFSELGPLDQDPCEVTMKVIV
jgi:glutaredoxin